MKKGPAVFLDRDGTIILDPGHIVEPGEVRLLEGAAGAIRRLNDAGVPAFVVSNQSVIARGWATHEQVHDVNDRIQALLGEASGAHVDAFYYCPHHPDLTGPCGCRKPAPGMLLQAAREHGIDLKRSYMIGDTATDIEAGINAGTRTVLLLTSGIGARSELEAMGKWPNATMDGVSEAVEWALRDLERRSKKGKKKGK